MNKEASIFFQNAVSRGPIQGMVPSAQQLIAQNRSRERDEERERLLKLSDEDISREIGQNMPLSETIKAMRDSIKRSYPGATVLFLGSIPINSEYTQICYEYTGNHQLLAPAMCEAMHHTKEAIEFINTTLMTYVKTCSPSQAEQVITCLVDLEKDFRARSCPETRIHLIDAEIKRLRKTTRHDLLKLREEERQELLDQIQRDKEAKKRAEIRYARQCECLARGRETQRKRREIEREKERQRKNNHQPNFAKMAKQKQQQIAARKAEKKKKKASEGGTDNVHSCSQLLSK